MIRRLLLAVAVVLALLPAASASALTKTVNFDDQQPGTFITTEYQGPPGVYFQKSDSLYPHVDSAPSQATSSPNVADVASCVGGCGESFVHPGVRGHLTESATALSVWVGYLASGAPGATAHVILTAYENGNPNPVASTSTDVSESAAFVHLSVSAAAGHHIDYFDLGAPNGGDESKPVAFDDLAITFPDSAPPPDFSISAGSAPAEVYQGTSVDVPIDVNRENGSNGNVALSVSGLPTGMTASFAPNPVTGSGATATMTLTAAADAPPSDSSYSTLTITATPDSGAGSTARSTSVLARVRQNCLKALRLDYIDDRTSGCQTRVGHQVTSVGTDVELNGLLLAPADSSSSLTVDDQKKTIVSSGSYRVSLPSEPELTFYAGKIDWRITAKPGDPQTVVDVDNHLGDLVVKSIPVSHTTIALTQAGGATIAPTLNLSFWPFNYFDSLSATTSFKTDNDHGANFGGLEIKFDKVEVLGLGLKDVDIKYLDGNTWSGKATVVLPFTPPLSVGAGISLKNGKLDSLLGSVDGLNISIGEGIFLQKIGFEADVSPPALSGDIGISGGPQIAGKTAASIDGGLKVTLADPWVVEVDGSVKIADRFELGDAFVRYTSASQGKSSLLELGGKAKWDLGVGSVNVAVSGWLQDTSAFDLEGTGTACVHIPFFPDPCASASLLVSNIGIAACVDLSVVSGGIGYSWGGGVDLFGGSCDLGPWRPTQSSAAAAAAGTHRVTLPAGLPGAAFAVDGAGGAPGVAVRGPHGESVAVSRSQPFLRNGSLVAAMNDNGTTYVEVRKPAAGVWTISDDGSVPVRRVRVAYGLPQPSVHASVTGRGRARTLRWRLRPIEGQQVRFVEYGTHLRQPIAATRAGSGRVRFRSAVGPGGRRRIVALVIENGRPRKSLVVASYVAPATDRPARARHVRIARHGTRITVSWRAPRQGFRYAVYVEIGHGRRLLIIAAPSQRSVVVAGVAPRDVARAVVVGLTAANGKGPSARATTTGPRKKKRR